nr:PEPxxWA-CTERM sorting domain-containing protein [Sandaracinobacteroides hominis]
MRITFGRMAAGARFAAVAACAIGAAAGGTAAFAQISNITTERDAELVIGGNPVLLGTPVPSPYYLSQPSSRFGAGYASYSNIAGNEIYFEAGSMAAGNRNSAKSVVEVSFDVFNNDAVNTITQIQSTIFESTFGFYVSDFFNPFVNGLGDVVEGCSGVVLPSCGITDSGAGFSNFTNFSQPPGTKDLAFTSFKFEVLQDGATVNEVSGSLVLQNTGGVISYVAGAGNADLSSQLINFQQQEDSGYAYIFGWDRTNFIADLANPLAFGDSSTFTYRITTEAWSSATVLGAPSTNMIISFACFADPLGRGGNFSAAILPLGDPSDDTCDDYGQLGNNSPKVYTLGIPTIKDGRIIFTAPGVPEPDTWAMLIAGFGLVGLSMRRRRPMAAATVTA